MSLSKEQKEFIKKYNIDKNKKSSGKFTKLDLHGVKHEDVRREVIRYIEDNWDSGDMVEIITGHSEKMKGIVFKVLMEYKLNYGTLPNKGSITVVTTGTTVAEIADPLSFCT